MEIILNEQIGIFQDPLPGRGLCTAVQFFNMDGGYPPTALSMVARHLDLADETNLEVAQQQATHIADRLLDALDADIFQSVAGSGIPLPARLARPIESVNKEAVETGAYYSVLAAQLSGDRLLACGIGSAHGWLRRERQIHRILQPTAWPSPSSNQAIVLNAALGIGFRADAIQSLDVHLVPEAQVWLALGTSLFEFNQHLNEPDLPASEKMDVLLKNNLSGFSPKPAVLAVIRAG